MNKLRRWWAILLFLPLLIGIGVAIALQADQGANPIWRFQFRADLATLIGFTGGVISTILLVAWALRRAHVRRLQAAQSDTRRDVSQAHRRFLGRLDHELKNPITALRAELAFLSQCDLPEESGPVLGDMTAQLERLGRLISDLRKLGQLEEQSIQRRPVAVEELLTEVVEAAEDHPNFAERSVRLTLLQRPWSLPEVPGDRGLLWLASYNLLDNALKFTPPDAEIEVRAFETGPWLAIEVADNGSGIPEGDLPHVFDELYRGENARGYPGSGLGLALVHAIVALHQGTLSVRSRSGQGTVFTIHVPTSL